MWAPKNGCSPNISTHHPAEGFTHTATGTGPGAQLGCCTGGQERVARVNRPAEVVASAGIPANHSRWKLGRFWCGVALVTSMAGDTLMTSGMRAGARFLGSGAGAGAGSAVGSGARSASGGVSGEHKRTFNLQTSAFIA